MKWNLWYGLFTTLTHNQPLSLAEKMTHLQTLTAGIANQAISGFSCNIQTYDAALAELQRRFGRPEIIANKFLHLLRNFRQPSIQQRHFFTEFLTFINNLVETFQSLGFTKELNSTLYVQFAVNKLPPTQRLQWTQYAVSNNLQKPSLIHFNIWIRQFALACDNLPFNFDDGATSSSISKNQLSRVTPVKQHRPLCPFDNSDHHPAHCSTYKNASLEQRRRMILDKKLCLICLVQHLKTDCKSQHSCRSCSRKHHSSLHDDHWHNSRQTREQTNDNSNSRPTTQIFAIKTKPNQSTQFADGSSTDKTPPAAKASIGAWLMVVPVTLENDNTFVSTYAILDNGSTCSYLLSNIANSLNCAVKEPSVKLEIGGFHEPKTLDTKRVSLIVHLFGNIAESFNLSRLFVLLSFKLADVDTHSLNAICQQNPHLNGNKFPQLLHNQIGLISCDKVFLIL